MDANDSIITYRTLICVFCFSKAISLSSLPSNEVHCAAKDYGHGSSVCVCNEIYCDTPDFKIGALPVSFTSSKAGLRFEKYVIPPGKVSAKTDFNLALNSGVLYQEIIGFGGAISDSASVNINSLSSILSTILLGSYFSLSGIGYTVARVPIASCDFSLSEYSYDDVFADFSLSNFSLNEMDLNFKIPLLHRILGLMPAEFGLRIFASPWSAPGWMKTNSKMDGNGTLLGQPCGKYYKTWANYFVKFLQQYKMHNITFWGLTAQNEPTTGYVIGYSFQTMGFTPELQRDFIKCDLGPALEAAGFGNVKLMILDDQRLMLPEWAKIVLSDDEANRYISGVAVHWYEDFFVPPSVLTATHDLFPDYFLFGSEACAGSMPFEPIKVLLGSWTRAENYARDIISDLNNWVTGWTDWNIALDEQGGPNWAKNFVDSPIIVNASANEFYKQPLFYALGHFSKFLIPGSRRINWNVKPVSDLLSVTAFIHFEKRYFVVVLLNRDQSEVSVVVRRFGSEFLKAKAVITTYVPAQSIQTIVWPF